MCNHTVYVILDVAKKITILGEDIIEVVQGSPASFHVQLRKEDGEIAESKESDYLVLLL